FNEFPIMRRCKDDWVNATQILKCCNFPKAKRTKILEKGVQQGLHEKIQGGFGRFQGTWIPLPDAQKLAAEYGLAPEAAPVLYLDVTDPNLHIPEKLKASAKEPTPVKRKYTKKNKNQYIQNLQMFQLPNGKYASQHQLPPTFQQSEFIGTNGMNGSMQMPNGSINQVPNFTAHNQMVQNEFQNYQMQYRLQQQQQQQQLQQYPIQYGQPNGVQQPHLMGNFQHTKHTLSQSTNETNWSQDEISNNHQTRDSDTSLSSNEDPNSNKQIHGHRKDKLDVNRSPEGDDTYAAQLLKFFSDDNSDIPYFVHNPPYDFNINEPIDDEGHTPLHWAASIGNYQMIHLLLSKGASPLVVNNFGLNPLSKLISFNNCYEMKNFPKVLDDLELCLINTDINGRTPLHYLCQFAKVKSKYESLRYYLNVILNKLTSLSNQNSNKQIDLLKNVLDHQDVSGDTCLHLAAKAGSSKIVRTLLNYGARDDLENIHKETSKLLIMHYNLSADQSELQSTAQYQVLATPVQPNYGGRTIETPDTQRTTIQVDDMEEDDTNARVVKSQLETYIKSEDNKENIFMENSMTGIKNFESVSTPIQKSTPLNGSVISHQTPHEQLALITERTVESTPIREDRKSLENFSVQHAYKPKPPKLDEVGQIVEDELDDEADKVSKLPMIDLSSMITGMINSFSDSYEQEMKKLEADSKILTQKLKEKEEKNNESLASFQKVLGKSGIENFGSIDEGKELLENEVSHCKQQANSRRDLLLARMQNNNSSEVVALVQQEEEKIEAIDNDSDDDINMEEKLNHAVELTKLQIERNNLLEQLAHGVTNFGIDSKMYKYRKLISLSCGLKVEDIDSLIDGIEASLMETV
ncbi:uncharacterized protein CANTADRAFT_33551, partial [Suhomyces tanzawaensis NRRL Y-17324]